MTGQTSSQTMPHPAAPPRSDPVADADAAASRSRPTVWGLTPSQVHDRFWASRGVQVVRQGEPSEIVSYAEGDIYHIQCFEVLEYKAELANLERFEAEMQDMTWEQWKANGRHGLDDHDGMHDAKLKEART